MVIFIKSFIFGSDFTKAKIMKKHLLLIMAILSLAQVYSQEQSNPYLNELKPLPKAYIGLSTGLNNVVGIIGLELKIVASPKFLIGAGIGLGSWGYKYSAHVDYHPKGVYAFFIKGGYMHASGLSDFENEMEISNGQTQMVTMDLKPVGDVFLSFGYAWKLGKKSRFHLEGGYAVPLNTDAYYEVTSGETLSNTSETVMQMLRPGGLVIALGFDIGI